MEVGNQVLNSALASARAELHITTNWSLAAKFDGEFAAGSETYAGTVCCTIRGKAISRDSCTPPALRCSEVSQPIDAVGHSRRFAAVGDSSAHPPIATESLHCGSCRAGPLPASRGAKTR